MIMNASPDMRLRFRTRDGQVIPGRLPKLTDMAVLVQKIAASPKKELSLYDILHVLARCTDRSEMEVAESFGPSDAVDALNVIIEAFNRAGSLDELLT